MDYRSKEAAEYRRWYHLARWKGPRGRRAVQLQAEPLCRFCEAAGDVVAATVADHIQPHRGDAELFWNGELQSLCGPCHSQAKQMIEARGYHDRCDAAGYPIDLKHPANKRRT
jgi:5-methylcytosine-specific restriction protein A